METVYIMEPGAYLRRSGETLKVTKDRRTIDEIPAAGMKKLILIGYVSLTGGVLDFLINRRVETVFMTPTGRFRARLGIDEHRHVTLRIAQYRKLTEDAFVARTARAIVKGKIDNMQRLLVLRGRQYGEIGLQESAVRLGAFSKSAATADKIEILRGLEGAATRVYFAAFRFLIRNDAFFFKGRNRRPPLDPVNAMLSFVYTLMTNEVLSAVKACGLDPYLGSLHEVSYGRPSLACDLVEEYRTFLGDRFVLGLINRKAVSPEDFVYRGPPPAEAVDEEELKARRPVEMKPAVGRAFIAGYEAMMKRRFVYAPTGREMDYRGLMLAQVRRFSNYLQEEATDYKPYVWSV